MRNFKFFLKIFYYVLYLNSNHNPDPNSLINYSYKNEVLYGIYNYGKHMVLRSVVNNYLP